MNRGNRFKLIELEWPEFGECSRPPFVSSEELQNRIFKIRTSMERLGLTHLIIYGDREHFANLLYLAGFEPRYEESILILGLEGTPLILVGNECEGYLNVSNLYIDDKLRKEVFQSFSLLNQPRDKSRRLEEIFLSEGINKKSFIGCVGWKYFEGKESEKLKHLIDIPSYIVDTLRKLLNQEKVINSTELFMHPDYGLRTFCSASEIAFFEYSNILGSEFVKKVIKNLKEGMTDFNLIRMGGYVGEPLNCHITFLGEDNYKSGLSGPTGSIIKKGNRFAVNIGYWGSNICRAGWVVKSKDDLPFDARDYVESFAGLYYEAMGKWFELLRIGKRCEEVVKLFNKILPYSLFGIFLNPGHLIHMDEWISSPFYINSNVSLHSGMYIQSDVIPYSKKYFSTRCEEGYIIADDVLRLDLKNKFPECYQRCQNRRNFMRDILGIDLAEEVLPLSNIPSIVSPYLLDSNTIFSLK